MKMIEAVVRVKPEQADLFERTFRELQTLVHTREAGTPSQSRKVHGQPWISSNGIAPGRPLFTRMKWIGVPSISTR